MFLTKLRKVSFNIYSYICHFRCFLFHYVNQGFLYYHFILTRITSFSILIVKPVSDIISAFIHLKTYVFHTHMWKTFLLDIKIWDDWFHFSFLSFSNLIALSSSIHFFPNWSVYVCVCLFLSPTLIYKYVCTHCIIYVYMQVYTSYIVYYMCVYI